MSVRYVIHGRHFSRHARVSIGIPTYNGSQRIDWLFQSMQHAGGMAVDTNQVAITLLDDGSTRPNELSNLVSLADRNNSNLLVHPRNEGITRSWNDLVRHVESEYCVLLNDDVILTPRWLDNLVYFLEHNECGAASPELLFCTEEDIPPLLRCETVVPREPHTKAHCPELALLDPEKAPGVVMCALGSGFGFKRSVFDRLGGFDERTVQIYNESWFGTKAARDLKLPSYCIPTPRIWHLWSATFKENPELGHKMGGDRAAYISEFGGDFQGPNGTHPRFMVGTMPPRVVKWLGPDGQPRERELTVQ